MSKDDEYLFRYLTRPSFEELMVMFAEWITTNNGRMYISGINRWGLERFLEEHCWTREEFDMHRGLRFRAYNAEGISTNKSG